ncbi:MAG: DUF554 domain-containing protein [Thermoguttaceae bacterium]|nr:DUF554 domain-containing protein [Thermoguttaceae bacterium]
MLAVFVNMAAVLIGGCFGLLFRTKIKPEHAETVIDALALATIVIGGISAIETQNLLCLIVCLTLGTVVGTVLKLDAHIKGVGDFVSSRLFRNNERFGKFTEGFVAASTVFCVGAMTVVGSFKAGIERDYSIIFAKSALDFIGATFFAVGMGIGVPFAALFVLVFQGGLTLLASYVAPFLSEKVVVELSAVGGAILIGLGLNMLEISNKKIKVADMTPAIFLPIAFLPIYELITQAL